MPTKWFRVCRSITATSSILKSPLTPLPFTLAKQFKYHPFTIIVMQHSHPPIRHNFLLDPCHLVSVVQKISHFFSFLFSEVVPILTFRLLQAMNPITFSQVRQLLQVTPLGQRRRTINRLLRPTLPAIILRRPRTAHRLLRTAHRLLRTALPRQRTALPRQLTALPRQRTVPPHPRIALRLRLTVRLRQRTVLQIRLRLRRLERRLRIRLRHPLTAPLHLARDPFTLTRACVSLQLAVSNIVLAAIYFCISQSMPLKTIPRRKMTSS